MPNLEILSAKKLEQEISKRSAIDSAMLTALIQAGYGNITGNALDAMVKADKADSLVIKARKASHAYHEALDEQDRRRHWHGTDKPIKKSKLY